MAKTLETQWVSQKDSVEKLKEALRGLDQKIEEAKRKRNILVSRKKRAEAQRMINETLASINSKGSFDTFERMEDRITQLEAESEATAELGELPEASLESQFKALEAGDVDDELSALKRKMALKAGDDAPKAIGGEVDESEATPEPNQSDEETSEKVDEVELDAELAELKRKLSAT